MTQEDLPATDIYIVGTGIVGYRQLTNEAIAAVERSTSIHLLHTQELVYEHFESEFDADVVDVRDEYEVSEVREEIYERMAAQVLSEAEEATDPVTFALYGHPLVYVSPAKLILEAAPDRDLTVDVRPGVSAMDCLYTDLNLDPARRGIQMYEATDLLLREYELNNYVPLMIWQIDSVETTLYTTAASSGERFTRLKEYLKQYYPADHTVILCRTSTTPIAESEQIEYELDNLEAIHETVTPTHTLYVPPAREREIQRPELRQAVRSTDHLDEITETE